jgi:hypothetical protein
LKESTYYCDCCKKKKDFFDLKRKVKLPIEVSTVYDEFHCEYKVLEFKKCDLCFDCLEKIISSYLKFTNKILKE